MTTSVMKRGLAAALVALAFMGLLAGTALAGTTEVLGEVTQAAQLEGVAPATDTLALQERGAKVVTDSGNVGLAVEAGVLTHTAAGSIVDGKGHSQVVFQTVGDAAYRASIHIDRPSDPERYEFNVVGAAKLEPQFDGSVRVLDSDGQVVAAFETPWARDANGAVVPTHYEINGTKLTQVVEHHGGGFVYGIVADPFWSIAKKAISCTAWGVVNLVPATAWVKRMGGTVKALKVLRRIAKEKGNWKKKALIVAGAWLDLEQFEQHCL